MKSSIELKELRNDIISKLEVIKETATAEERDLTNDENNEMDTLLLDADKLSVKIERTEKVETEIRNNVKLAGTPVQKVNTEKATRGWSLFKAINEVRNGGQLSGLELECHQEAEREARKSLQGIGIPTMMKEDRAIVQGAAGATTNIAPTAVGAYVDSLQASALYNRIGINDLGTVAADTVLPIAGGSTVGWDTEVAASTDGGADFAKVTLTPKRLAGYANLSNVILAQNGPAAEASVMRDMGRNMGTQIDAAMFGSSTVTSAPTAIVATTGTLTFTESAAGGAAGASADMLEAIQTIADNHGLDGNLAFVNQWNLYSNIKSATQVASVSPLYSDDRLAGYPGYFSSAPASVASTSGDGLFGDFSRVTMCQFGPSSIMVDPYSRAVNGEVRLIMNNYMDWGVASGASFVKYTTVL
jgi:HK97 family phage major capsid protein